LKVDDKVVIFSQFLGMLDLLEEEMKKNGFNYVVIFLLFRECKEVTRIKKEQKLLNLSNKIQKLEYF
jgi:hypothetical protein